MFNGNGKRSMFAPMDESLDIKHSSCGRRGGGAALYVQKGFETGHELNNTNVLLRPIA